MGISSEFAPFNFYPVKSESHLIRAKGPFNWGQLNDLNHHNDRNVFNKPKNVNMSRMFPKSLVLNIVYFLTEPDHNKYNAFIK